MNHKFRNPLAANILLIIASVMFTACAGSNFKPVEAADNNSKILGTWKRTDRNVGMTITFTADGDYIVKNATDSLSGRYELKGDDLQVYFPQSKTVKVDNSKIFKLEGNSMILEVENNGRKSYSSLERIGN